RALGWRWPGETRYVLAMLGVLGLVGLVEFRTRVVIHHAALGSQGPLNPLVLEDDDINAFRDFSRELEQTARTENSRRAVNEFNRLIDDLANHRLESQEAFRRLSELQRMLEANQESD